MKKALAIFLALLMCCSVLPFAAFAADEEAAADSEIGKSAADTVAAWEENYAILLDTLMSGENYAHYKYVVDNSKDIQKTMDVYTAFGLYDNAWKNYFTKEANIDTCKKILMAMIEEYSFELGNSYVDSIIKGLEVAGSAGEFIEKLNGYVDEYSDVLSFVESQEWSTVFSVVNTLIKLGHAWQDIRTGLIKAYSQIMSVQLANGYYIEMLQYVADNTDYDPMRKAALALIDEATTAVEEQIAFFLQEATEKLQNQGINALLDLAVNSNVYTATAKKVWNVSASIADVLWNTGDQYALFDALVASFHAEKAINAYTVAAYDDEAENYDAARTLFATYALISVRSFGEGSLYNLLDAQAGGFINKIKSKIYNTSCTEYTANMEVLDLMSEVLYNTDVEDMYPVEAVIYVYCPVDVLVYDGGSLLFTLTDGVEETVASDYGVGSSAYCEYNKEYIKVAFLKDADYKVVMKATADGYVTFVKDVTENGVVNDYSFTEVAVTPGTSITVSGTSYIVTADGKATAHELNDEFVQPEGKEVTWGSVKDATKDVVKEETTNFLEKIKEFITNFFAKLKALFTIK